MTRKASLIFTVAKALEEKFVDVLLADEAAASAGFSARDVSAFGAHITYRTSMERVHGRVKAVEITLLLNPPEVQSVLDVIRSAFSGRDVIYRLHDIADSGEF